MFYYSSLNQGKVLYEFNPGLRVNSNSDIFSLTFYEKKSKSVEFDLMVRNGVNSMI